MRLTLAALAALGAAGLLAGCADRVSLMPAPSATALPTQGEATGAVETVAGVRVAVISREWPGTAQISNAVTPLKVDIRNNSDQPVAIRYSEFRLTSLDGRTYSALPPVAIEATVPSTRVAPVAPRLAPGYSPITLPGFTATGFGVSPMYSPLYPGYPVATGPFAYDPLYYGNVGSYWRQVQLPTVAMARMALPEGVLQPGGQMQGYLYFQEIDPNIASLRFRMDVVSAGQGRELGTVEIPFLVS